MSWTKRSQEVLYRDFTEKAADESPTLNHQPWSLAVCDVSQDGQLREYVQNTARRLNGKPRLRMVFAPSDIPRRETKGLMVELFHKFGIPHDFTAERARCTNYSFSRRSDDDNGFSSWFRFSYPSHKLSAVNCESSDLEDSVIEGPALINRYTERQSAFFLQASSDTSITLVCFGDGPGVRKRMKDFIKSRGWADIHINPYILFDVILEGLYEEVDDTVWKIEEEFAQVEKSIIRLGGTEYTSSNPMIPLGELYSFERHITEFLRALESVVMVSEGVLSNTGIRNQSSSSPDDISSSRPLIDLQLKECLEYRRTLFRSTQLRLSNLQKRVEAATTLVSNLMIQQQSAAAIQGPVSMKLIAASIIIFLPTIAVATIAGSQLLLSEQVDEENSWDVSATPLFYLLWYISIPLTLAVIFLSLGWLWWRQGESRRVVQPSSWLRKVLIWRHLKGKKQINEDSSATV